MACNRTWEELLLTEKFLPSLAQVSGFLIWRELINIPDCSTRLLVSARNYIKFLKISLDRFSEYKELADFNFGLSEFWGYWGYWGYGFKSENAVLLPHIPAKLTPDSRIYLIGRAGLPAITRIFCWHFPDKCPFLKFG